jgi:hypothetical protein
VRRGRESDWAGQGDERLGIVGFLLTVRACACVCVGWELFIVNSAIQLVLPFTLQATQQQSAIPLVPPIITTALFLFQHT